MTTPTSLTELLARIRPQAQEDAITVADVLRRIGEDSFTPVILVPALLLVSPLSGIPGVPTIGAFIVATIALQWLLGRKHLWLPRMLMVRSVDAARFSNGLDFLAKPAAWFDRHSRDRLQLFFLPPFSLIAKLCVLLIPLTWPVLELLPFVTSIGAAAVALFAFGFMMRDGVYIMAGFTLVAAVGGLILWLTSLGSNGG